MLPLVVFVLLKLEIVLAPFNVVPPAELVVRSAPLIKPAPVSEILPVLVKLTFEPDPIEPVILIAPVLLTVILPPPAWLMPVMVKGAAVLVNAILPLVMLVALKFVMVLALFNVVPPIELVVNVTAEIAPL